MLALGNRQQTDVVYSEWEGVAGGGVKLKVCTMLKIVRCHLLFAELQLRDACCQSCLQIWDVRQQPARVPHMQVQSEKPFAHGTAGTHGADAPPGGSA